MAVKDTSRKQKAAFEPNKRPCLIQDNLRHIQQEQARAGQRELVEDNLASSNMSSPPAICASLDGHNFERWSNLFDSFKNTNDLKELHCR